MHLTLRIETLGIRAVLRARETPGHVRRTGLFAWAHAKSNKPVACDRRAKDLRYKDLRYKDLRYKDPRYKNPR